MCCNQQIGNAKGSDSANMKQSAQQIATIHDRPKSKGALSTAQLDYSIMGDLQSFLSLFLASISITSECHH